MSIYAKLRKRTRLIALLVVLLIWIAVLSMVAILSVGIAWIVSIRPTEAVYRFGYIIPFSFFLAAALLTLCSWYFHEPLKTIEKVFALVDERRRQKAEELQRRAMEEERQRRWEADESRRQKDMLYQKAVAEEKRRQKELEEARRKRRREAIEGENRRKQEFRQQSEEARIKEMGPLELERYAAELFGRQGYQASLTAKTGDHGVDISLISPGGEKEMAQCKQWKGKKVSEKELREFYGAMMHEGFIRGYYIAPYGFTSKARSWVANKKIVLGDARWLASEASKVAFEPRKKLVFGSTFDNSACKQLETSSLNHRVFCRDGYLHVAIAVPHWQYLVPITFPPSNFYASVETQFASNSGPTAQGGLIFGLDETSGRSYFRYGFTKSGEYTLHVMQNDKLTCLINYTHSTCFDNDDWPNTLSIQVIGRHISLGVNGVELRTVEAYRSPLGRICPFVSTSNEDSFAQVRFRNFQLYTIEK